MSDGHKIPFYVEEWMLKRGFKRSTIADKIGRSRGYIGQIIDGRDGKRLNAEHIAQFADALDVQPWQLLYGPPEADQSEEELQRLAGILSVICRTAARDHARSGTDLSKVKIDDNPDTYWHDLARTFQRLKAHITQDNFSVSQVGKVLEREEGQA